MKNECVDAAVNVLHRFGIKPEVRHLAKHIEILWIVNNQKRSYTAAVSTSDRRAVLNIRAIKKLLRQDNVAKPKKPDVRSFEHAMASPVLLPVEPLPDRIKRCEDTLDSLFELICELQNPHQRTETIS